MRLHRTCKSCHRLCRPSRLDARRFRLGSFRVPLRAQPSYAASARQPLIDIWDGLLDKGNTCNDVFADSAYRSAKIESKLRASGYNSRIYRRGRRNHPLSLAQMRVNHAKSRIRARIEHVASKVSGTARPSIDRPRTVQSWTRGARFEVDRRAVRDRRRGRLPGIRSFDLRDGRHSVDRRRLHRLVDNSETAPDRSPGGRQGRPSSSRRRGQRGTR